LGVEAGRSSEPFRSHPPVGGAGAEGEAILIERIKPKRWTAAEDAELMRLAKSGVSEPDIARQLGRSIIATIQRTAKLKTKQGQAMTDSLPNASQRQLMQRLRTDAWRSLSTITVAAGDRLLASLVRNGWIERNGGELRLTTSGLEALRAKLPAKERPQHAGKVPLPKPQVRPGDGPD
jgi:hypothetical protein